MKATAAATISDKRVQRDFAFILSCVANYLCISPTFVGLWQTRLVLCCKRVSWKWGFVDGMCMCCCCLFDWISKTAATMAAAADFDFFSSSPRYWGGLAILLSTSINKLLLLATACFCVCVWLVPRPNVCKILQEFVNSGRWTRSAYIDWTSRWTARERTFLCASVCVCVCVRV